METLTDIALTPLVNRITMHAVPPSKWSELFNSLAEGEPVRMVLGTQWRTIRSADDLWSYVRDGGEIW